MYFYRDFLAASKMILQHVTSHFLNLAQDNLKCFLAVTCSKVLRMSCSVYYFMVFGVVHYTFKLPAFDCVCSRSPFPKHLRIFANLNCSFPVTFSVVININAPVVKCVVRLHLSVMFIISFYMVRHCGTKYHPKDF